MIRDWECIERGGLRGFLRDRIYTSITNENLKKKKLKFLTLKLFKNIATSTVLDNCQSKFSNR